MNEQYKKSFVDTLMFFIDDPRVLCTNNVISNIKVAKLLKVSRESVRRWRTPEIKGENKFYQKNFKKAIDKLQEVIYSGDIKIGLIERARGFKQHKFIHELKETAPILPALSKLGLKRLKEYARIVMHLKFENGISRPILEMMIRQAAEKMTKAKLVVTKHEVTDIAADPAAAKMVLPNIGDKDWKFGEDINVKVTNLADVAAVMAAKRKKSA